MSESKMFALGEVKAVEDAAEPNGSFDVILSAPTVDRDGEVIDARVFEPLPDHITFDIDHGMSTATTVGSGTPYYDGDVLRVKGTYSSIPRAQEVRTLVREGHIRTTSVAFMSAKREEKDGVPHIVKAELLNGAFVPIPSNRESVVLSAKSHDARVAGAKDIDADLAPIFDALVKLKAGSRNSTKDAERLQAIHDLVIENGAKCATDDAAISTEAPETPAVEAGKSLASEVVAAARIRAQAALLAISE
jgi:hypothetical protein